jgi:hypothetical protein
MRGKESVTLCKLIQGQIEKFGMNLDIEGLNCTFKLDKQGITLTVKGLARWHFDPAFTDAIFLNIVTLFAIESNADVVFENGRNIERTASVN